MSAPGAVRVVVAEDEAIIRLDLVETLREEGFDVVADTGRGDEAVRLVAEHRPDVAILDVKMPGLDGIEAARQIAPQRGTAVVIPDRLQPARPRRAGSRGRRHDLPRQAVPPRRHWCPAVELALARYREMEALEGQVGDLEDRLEVRKIVEPGQGTPHRRPQPERAGRLRLHPAHRDVAAPHHARRRRRRARGPHRAVTVRAPVRLP